MHIHKLSDKANFLRKAMFWDCDFDSIDLDKHKNLIVQRVTDFGTWQEFLKMLRFYGKETVLAEAQTNRELSEHGMYFFSHFLNGNIKDFLCYKKRQSTPIRFHF